MLALQVVAVAVGFALGFVCLTGRVGMRDLIWHLQVGHSTSSQHVLVSQEVTAGGGVGHGELSAPHAACAGRKLRTRAACGCGWMCQNPVIMQRLKLLASSSAGAVMQRDQEQDFRWIFPG